MCGAYDPGSAEMAGADLYKVTLDDPEALCNDGTPAVMFIRPSTGGEFSNRWVIYLQGGGSCQDLESCGIRYCGTDEYTKAKMSSTWTDNAVGESALFTRDGDNPLGEANQVLVHYCSSDSWTGTNRDVVLADEENHPGESFRLHFRGREIVRAAIDTLKAGSVRSDDGSVSVPSLADATTVILAGSSAGSRGAQNNLDWVAEQLPSARVMGWFDASSPPTYEDMGEYGQPVADFDRDVRWVEYYQATWGMWVDESCSDLHPPDEQWLCGNADHLVQHHVTTPFFVRQDIRDTVTGGRYLDFGAPLPFLAEVWALSMDRIHEAPLTGEEGASMTVAPGVYSPNCGQHVGLNDQEWFTEALVRDDDVDGTWYSHRGAFIAWYLGRSVEVLDGEPSTRSVCVDTNDDGG
jgi:hypothetical protein